MTENTVAVQEKHDGSNAVMEQHETREAERFLAPPVDIFEKDDGLYVIADMPGVEKGNVDVTIENDILTIRGTVRQSIERDYLLREFVPVSFYRQFRLGSKINRDRIDAELRHGVLRLKLPFAEEAKPRTIEVKVG